MQPRFTFVVDDVYQLDDGGVIATGYVRGTIEKGNRVYVITPDENVRVAFIDGIEAGGVPRLASATDQVAALHIDSIIVQDQLPLLSVITSVEPVFENRPMGESFENPFLEALIWEAVDSHLSNAQGIFHDQLVASIRAGKYLCLVDCKNANGTSIKGKRLPGLNATRGLSDVGFGRLFIGDPNGEKQEVFPLFTGYSTLPLDEEGDSPIGNSTMRVSFDEACSLRPPTAQLVVNPFGPVQLSLTGLA